MKRICIYMFALLSAATTNAQQTLSPMTKAICHGNTVPGRHQVYGEKMATAYLTIDTSTTNWQTLAAAGFHVAAISDEGWSRSTATVRLPYSRIDELSAMEGVVYVQLSNAPQPMLDIAREETGADKVKAGTGIERGYTGKGVVVGVVDDGFDYNHAAFRNPADGTLRIKRIWEQGTDAMQGCEAPAKYGYGIELVTSEQITTAAGDDDINSHGTHVTGIAAGSDSYMEGAWQGTAPEADIVLVSLDRYNTTTADISNAVAYIFDYADEMGMPCVVNLSLGFHEGPHDGTSTFDVMADKMQGKGRLIVGSAGNHRADQFHVSHTFASADEAPLSTFIAYKQAPSANNVGGNIEIWGEEGCDFEVQLSAYSIFNKQHKNTVTVYPAEGDMPEVKLGSYVTGSYSVSSEISPLNNKPHVLISSAITNMRNNYAVAITVVPKTKGQVDIWADNTRVGLESLDIEGFTAPGNASTIAEIGGTGKRILSVGAYTTRTDMLLENGTSTSVTETLGNISSFSSYGPTADGRVKPDVAAPGCLIISALSSNDLSGTQLVAHRYSDGGRDNIYGYMQGTSMSSPFVAGVVATWLQAYPELTPEQLKEIISATARTDDSTGDLGEQGNNDWGFGKIDAFEGLKSCIELASTGIRQVNGSFNGDLRLEGDCIYIGALAAAPVTATLYDTTGRRLFMHNLGIMTPGDNASVSVASLPGGTYLLQVSTPQSVKTVKFVKK